ncbi:hypothetical protein PINS_up011515 [Pythium insidiosum]|nr:hypothetical protein PINS_up011515 [Pythium insidiosum]
MGTWVALEWENVEKVTFLVLRTGQSKLATPTLNDSAAPISDGRFLLCAKAKGEIVLRGWGKDTCRQASTEKIISVVDGADGATCEAKKPQVPTTSPPPSNSSSSSSNRSASDQANTSDAELTECNLSRASVKLVDGEKRCVCAQDWANPPACDNLPPWKWAITIGGGIAALLSIAVSVRAYVKSRQKHQQRLQDDDDDALAAIGRGGDIETIRIAASSPHPSSISSYNQLPVDHRGTSKSTASNAPECTL